MGERVYSNSESRVDEQGYSRARGGSFETTGSIQISRDIHTLAINENIKMNL